MTTSKQIRLKINTSITDLTAPELDSISELLTVHSDEDSEDIKEMEAFSEKLSEAMRNDEKFSFYTEAEYACDGKQISIAYRETREMGLSNCITVINFDLDDPQSVRMARSGEVRSAMLFDSKADFQICSYNVNGMPFEFTIFTRSIHNRITENGGTLEIDYVILMQGKALERNILELTVLE